MGFLEANRFGFAIAGSHSSRTAEGDNAVLMNKVASELIQKEGKNATKLVAKFKAGQLSLLGPVIGSRWKLDKLVSSRNPDLKQLINLMHNFYEYNMANLMVNMQSAVKKHGRVSAWMEHCQNDVQSTARAYGEWAWVSQH